MKGGIIIHPSNPDIFPMQYPEAENPRTRLQLEDLEPSPIVAAG